VSEECGKAAALCVQRDMTGERGSEAGVHAPRGLGTADAEPPPPGVHRDPSSGGTGAGATDDGNADDVEEDDDEEELVPMLEHVEIRDSQHGGLGLFALRDFAVGDVVLRERPYLAIKHLPWEDVAERLDHASESSQMIRAAVDDLDAENASLFWSFTQTDLYGDVKTPQGVFWTNMIELYKDVEEDEDSEGVSCMFEVTSRLNHACVPSVEWISYAVMPLVGLCFHLEPLQARC